MRYIIGIDLGTTNSCISFVDTTHPKLSLQQLRIPQLNFAGYLDHLATLPSFCYLEGGHALPWNKNATYAVGEFAREQGAKTPTRLVESAKSWLCHFSADRRDKILPFESADEKERISPVEATARYLRHLKDAWNHIMAKGVTEAEFEQQEIVLTVPASFDEVARSLTVEAAKLAGFLHLTLLEEPQAAFYSWIAQNEEKWETLLPVGTSVLVCDIGGGTTDFSLIEAGETEGKRILTRTAVGDHLLLGGDNMDAALAHAVERRLGNGCLPSAQWLQLKYQARKAKEVLLGENAPDVFRFTLQGSGSSVVKNTLSVECDREETKKLLTEGFFGSYAWDDALQLNRASGFKAMGLPYEVEPSITKHLAAFLKSPQLTKAPDFVLFNGGAVKPAIFQDSILRSLEMWFPGCRPEVLTPFNLDLAVARGAAYYGKARRGLGVKVGGGAARGLYLGIELQDAAGRLEEKALTLLPRGSEEGSTYEPSHTFLLRPNVPVAFTLYTSHVRLHDQAGETVAIDRLEMQALPPIHTVLRFGKQQASEAIPVHVGVSLTAIGTLDLWVRSVQTPHRWQLEFQLRSAVGPGSSLASLGTVRRDETFDVSYLQPALAEIETVFSENGKEAKLMERLEELLEKPRREWPPGILRGLWEAVIKQAPMRNRTQALESRWWNLAGFVMRPGFGYPLDDFRIKEMWKVILADLKQSSASDSRLQRIICYRRIAGGLNKGQQTQIASDLQSAVFEKKSAKGKGEINLYAETVRALGSFEMLDLSTKVKLGNALVGKIVNGSAIPADYWALGRIGARRLFHGGAGNIVGRDSAAGWMEKLLAKGGDDEHLLFVAGQLARKTDQRELNLPSSLVEKILERFHDNPRLSQLLHEEASLSENEQEYIFGEKLPSGLFVTELQTL